MNVRPVVAVRALTRRFGSFTAVDAVTFEVAPGEIFGFLGANGAGKTTTIRMLCGIIPPTSAERAELLGIDLLRDHEAAKSRIGYMSQKFSLYADLSVRENLAFYGGVYGLAKQALGPRIAETAERTGLADILDQPTSGLPAGSRQRLALACAVLHGPRVLFLDEPTAGVDPRMRRNFWNLIRDLRADGVTVFVTTHFMDEAEACDRISVMHAGKLVALDTPLGLKQRHFPHRLYELLPGTPAALLDRLRAAGLVDSSQPFGTRFHAVVRADAERGFAAALKKNRLAPRRIAPSLEDVFLHILRTADAKGGKP